MTSRDKDQTLVSSRKRIFASSTTAIKVMNDKNCRDTTMIKATTRVVSQLAPTGVLRAGINLSNFLLVVRQEPTLEGPSPSMAQSIATALGVPLKIVTYDTPSQVADAATKNEWDIANIGNEPQRAKHIDFSIPYCEIEATYMVRNKHSDITSIQDVDSTDHKIAVKKGSAYGLWLEKNVQRAQLVTIPGSDKDVFDVFAADDSYQALAGLRPGLIKFDSKPDFRILDGRFTSVQQSVGIGKEREEALDWLNKFVSAQKQNGSVASWIDEHGLDGKLSVAR